MACGDACFGIGARPNSSRSEGRHPASARYQGAQLGVEFDAAKERADRLGQLVREVGGLPAARRRRHQPLLALRRACHGRSLSRTALWGCSRSPASTPTSTAAKFFQFVSTNGRVGCLFDFENKKIFFKDVHASQKFCVLVLGGEERKFDETECAFFLHDTATVKDPERCFPLAPDDFARVNPNTGTAPVFRTRRDAEITRRIYERHPVLVDRSDGGEHKVWPVRYRQGLFHSLNHSSLFRTAEQLNAEGFYPVEGNRWKKGNELFLPLYEGKMVQAFDHRAASVVTQDGNLFRPGQAIQTLDEQHRIPTFSIRPRFWISQLESPVTQTLHHILTFKEITATTNARTMIASMVPQVGCLDTLPVLLPDNHQLDALSAACVLANLNSLGFDYCTRQKIQGTHIKLYMLEQLPVIAPEDYDWLFGDTTARELVRDHVLRLTYTAHDMAPFARDLGYDGPPFTWDDEERRHLRARLDALYFPPVRS